MPEVHDFGFSQAPLWKLQIWEPEQLPRVQLDPASVPASVPPPGAAHWPLDASQTRLLGQSLFDAHLPVQTLS